MTISTHPNSYPIFEPNQVLQFTDLNTLFDYLDQHNRLTRTHLIGMGIVCGLTVELSEETAAIQISPGCGITSEGYLLHLEATTLTHYQMVEVSSHLFAPTSSSKNGANGSGNNGNNGSNGNNNGNENGIVAVIDLFASVGEEQRLELGKNPDGSDRKNLDELKDELENYVIVLVCELDETRRDSCLVDCDDRGIDRTFRTRFFLLPRRAEGDTLSAERLLRQGFQLGSLAAPWQDTSTEAVFTARHTFWQQPELRVRRFGYRQETLEEGAETSPVVRLSAIKTFDALMENYYTICAEAIEDIRVAFTDLFRIFSPLFSSFHPNTHADFEGLSNRLMQHLQTIWSLEDYSPSQLEAVEAQYAIQYFYDYLSQLIAAYHELAEAAFDLMDDCAPDYRRFPKFLMLGEPVTQLPCATPSPYRHHFVQPPIYNGNSQRMQQVQHLYERLRRLCETNAFFMLPFYDTPLAITPSPDRSAPLSQQAIPYYLNYPNIYRYWNYDACRKGISHRHPAYFYPLASGTPTTTTDVLVHRLDAYNFYRIEGHIGEANTTALNQIQDYQQRYNLAFDVITLKLTPSIEDLRDLNLSGHFEDLEADFGRMKDKFLKLWDKNKERWSRNVFLNTLKREFFEDREASEGSGLRRIRESKLSNRVLTLAENPDNFEFVPESTEEDEQATQFWLYLFDENETPVARFSTQRNLDFVSSLDTPDDLLFDFSELSEATISDEQERIRETLSACFTLGKVNFGVMPQSSEQRFSYYVWLSVDDTLDLPITDDETNEPSQVPVNLLWLNPFSIDISSDQPYIADPAFHDFETLYGLLRDVQQTPTKLEELGYSMSDQDAAECLNYFELKGLMEAYQHRLDRLKEMHLFHKFAELHPGLEPLGGVPKGGTFVLVYVDGEEVVNDLLQREQNVASRAKTSAIKQYVRFPDQSAPASRVQQELLNRTDIVVADFCLPYRCCSDTPAVNYLLTKPRPVVLLEKSTFCEDDDTRYEFILDPKGGILKGEGSVLEGRQYYFQPSNIEIEGEERTVTFTYVVEGSYDTFTVVLYPKPEASLNLEDSYCNDHDPIDITLVETDPTVELRRVTVNGTEIEQFDPSQYAQENTSETVTIEAFVRDRRTGCENTISNQVTVYPLPNPAFEVDDAYPDAVCSDAEVPLNPDQPGGTFKAFVGDTDQEIPGAIAPDSPTFIARAVFDNNDLASQSVTLRHEITSEQGCMNEAEYSLTVYRAPIGRFAVSEPEFSYPEPQDEFSVRISDIEPEAEEGTYNYEWTSDYSAADTVSRSNSEPFSFVLSYGEGDVDLTSQIAISLTVSNSASPVPCQGEPFTQTFAPPFEIADWMLVGVLEEGAFEPLVELTNFIKENERISLAQFFQLGRDNQRFALQTRTRPARVGSVQITYQLPERDEQDVIHDQPPYVSELWTPVIGRYTFTLQAFAGAASNSRESDPVQVSFEIIESGGGDEESDSPNDDIVVTDSGDDLDRERLTAQLDERLAEYRDRTGEIELSIIERDDMTAEDVANFVLTTDRTTSPSEAVGQYENTINTLLEAYENPQDRTSLTAAAQLIRLSTASLLDRLVLDEIDAQIRDRLTGIIDRLQEADIKPNGLVQAWKPNALEENLDSERFKQRIEQLKTLLRSV